MLIGSTSQRRSTRRRAVAEAKVTFKTFVASIRPQQVGERATSRHRTQLQAKGLTSKRPRVIALGFVVAFALSGATYAVVNSFGKPGEHVVASDDSAQASAAPCLPSLSETTDESRTTSVFGGVKVETGEVECNGVFFIVSQTSTAEGKILSVKKKRA